MKLREDPLSAKKPDITTDLEIFVKEGRDGSGGGGGGGGGGGAGMRRGLSSHSHGPYGMRGSSSNALYPDFNRTSISQRVIN